MSTLPARRIVVVGGSLGGLRATEALLAGGWDGEIVVLSDEPHVPYTRPPLSKAALAGGPDLATLAVKQRPEAARAEWRFGATVVAADLAARTVTLADGETVAYDGLVAATGVRPRRLPSRIDHTGGAAHVVRTIEDCRVLHSALRTGSRVVVIGAGFIGCEVAATAVGLGCEVTVVAADESPMLAPLGRTVGDAVRRRHERAGVKFRLGVSVSAVDHGYSVSLSDGSRVDGDVVVQSIGSAPCVGWLSGNGLDLADGVATDNGMRAGGITGVVAVGDVARFPNPLFDDVPRRVEHWQTPMETARRAAVTLLADLAGHDADPAPFTPLPSFWSDQFDLRLQSFGALGIADRTEVLEGDLGGQAVVGYFRGTLLVGALLLGMPKRAVAVRKRLLAGLTDPQPTYAA
ncbi:ferredoxin reductase [Prauserella marina]|uniref:Reductase C-terminal n=1 Tax=Prauserella marina TaxID=530584 RepID=A0A222VUR9_9PSEU|nr:FAD-dependent oxidoreductase [Prauserella marina]ASR37667.1 ferredoxin reductase [Prauserella marina]PWV75591.1 NAD/ferredoxin-dependent reductase-like protein [Prauserella marina]SDD31108.1 Reductase C-terminal [Prauserella marina]